MQDRTPEEVHLAAHISALADALSADHPIPMGRLLGLPELPNNDYWVDIAGAAAITRVPPRTITGWLSRGGPRHNPFPTPRRHLYRLHWPRTEITSWQAENVVEHSTLAVPPRRAVPRRRHG
jgi:hypothetical protein